MEGIVALLAGLSAYVFMIGIFKSQESTLKQRLESLKNADKDPFKSQELNDSFFNRVIRPYLEKLAVIGNFINSKFTPRGVNRQLDWAGRPLNLTEQQFYGTKVSLALFFPVLAFLICIAREVEGVMMIVGIAFGSSIFGYLFPDIWLRDKIRARQTSIERQLPATLDILTVSSNAGLSFNDSIKKMCDKTNGVLTEEFKKVLYDMKMGSPRNTALINMAERCGVEDLTKFVNAVVQSEKYGTSIAQVLDAQSTAMRTKLRNRSEEQANKAPVKLILPLVFFVLPALLLLLLAPAALKMMTSF
ncbi:MAG: type II secretion system F family protein [bacterium]